MFKKGYKPTVLHRQRIRDALLGRTSPTKGRTLSIAHRQKLSESHRGKQNGMWKGGRRTLEKQIRQLYKYRLWRSDVFQRDGFVCQDCDKGGRIEPHHIKHYASILDEYEIKTAEDALECEELWNINNGVTLCRPCHQERHENNFNRDNGLNN